MNARIAWRFVITAAIIAWCIFSLLPIKDTPFSEYVRDRATDKQAEFAEFLKQADANVEKAREIDLKAHDAKVAAEAKGDVYLPDAKRAQFAAENRTLFLAARTLAKEQKIDLASFFTDIRVADIKNLDKRNDVLMRELLRQSRGKTKLGLDLKGGVSFTLALDESAFKEAGSDPERRAKAMEHVVSILSNRINSLGVAEPLIRVRGGNSVEVQLPDVNTKEHPEAIDILKKPAKLEFRLVHPTIQTAAEVLAIPAEELPTGYEILYSEIEDKRTGVITEYPVLVKRMAEATGSIVEDASPTMSPNGGYEVALKFTSKGGDTFEEITRKIAEENKRTGRVGQLAIILDKKLASHPRVEKPIAGGRASISGNFSQREVFELANVLNNPLEFELKLVEMNEVGSSLAADARDSSMKAVVIGAGLVVLLMLVIYTFAGLTAVFAVILNLIMILGVQASLGATLTLPGIAALVLTVGMAVDANVLIFERIREELRHGKPLQAALEAGHENAFSTIVDANLTTLITAAILMWMGTGPSRGFGVILAIGLIANLFCVLVFNRALLEFLVNIKLVRKMRFINILPANTKINFFGHRKAAGIIALAVIVAGFVVIGMKGTEKIYSIDFLGGEEMVVQFEKQVPIADIEAVARANGVPEVTAYYQKDLTTGKEQLKIQTAEGQAEKLFTALEKAQPDAQLKQLGVTVIGAVVGDSIKLNALYSLLLAILGILAYIAFRFELGFGIGAVVSTISNILATVGIYVMLGGKFSAPMVAAVLMVTGYGINDTVVIFDRIREELKLNPMMKLLDVINLAVNRTLSRTILTSLTVFIASASLYVFGAGIVKDFAEVFVIGVVFSTFSSIFIASPVFFWWHKGDRKHVESSEFLPKHDWDSGKDA